MLHTSLRKSFYYILAFCSIFELLPAQNNDNTAYQAPTTEKAPEPTPLFEKEATIPCGKQPKQVLFSPDSNCFVLPLLNDKGFQVFNIKADDGTYIAKDAETSSNIQPLFINPPNDKKLGFAEGLFVPEKNAFFVSQMTSDNLYEYEYPGFTYKRQIPTKGTWSKFIAWSNEKQMLAVSNWVSNDVSLIDYDSGEVLLKLKTAAAPRGLAFIKKGMEIVVLCFDGGTIQKFNTTTGECIASLPIANSAMRHIVVNKDETVAYISDMHNNAVYSFDLDSFSITKTFTVFSNPNTIALLEDRYLIVSSRGPNNHIDYTLRSPVDGKVTIIDTVTEEPIEILQGGNQPTGLSVSPDQKFLCFSNFQDQDVELYEIKKVVILNNIPFYLNLLSLSTLY